MEKLLNALKEIEKHPFTWWTCFDWYDKSTRYMDNVPTLVEIGGKYAYYIKKENRYLTDMSFDSAKPFYPTYYQWEYVVVTRNGKQNILKIDGTFLLEEWCDYADSALFEEGFLVYYGDKCYHYGLDGIMTRERVLPKVKITIGHGYREGR